MLRSPDKARSSRSQAGTGVRSAGREVELTAVNVGQLVLGQARAGRA